MRPSTDPHNTLWTPADRNPVTLAQIGRAPPGLRYKLGALNLGEDDRGAHMVEQVRVKRWHGGSKGTPARFWTPEEEAMLLQCRRDGMAWVDIAARLGRTGIACEKRLLVLSRKGG